MNIFLNSLLAFVVIGLLFNFAMLGRSERVYRFRSRLMLEDFDLYERIADRSGYDEMVRQFWRPLTVKEWLKPDSAR